MNIVIPTPINREKNTYHIPFIPTFPHNIDLFAECPKQIPIQDFVKQKNTFCLDNFGQSAFVEKCEQAGYSFIVVNSNQRWFEYRCEFFFKDITDAVFFKMSLT